MIVIREKTLMDEATLHDYYTGATVNDSYTGTSVSLHERVTFYSRCTLY